MTFFTRRGLLAVGSATLVSGAVGWRGSTARAQSVSAPPWRSFAVTTRVAVPHPKGSTRLWLPLPSAVDEDWVKAGEPVIETTGSVEVAPIGSQGERVLAVAFPADTPQPEVKVTALVQTRDRQVNLEAPGAPRALSAELRASSTRGTELIPTDGIVRDTAAAITASSATDLAKARAIYEWVVENTFRDAKVRGCGTGDVAAMLQSGTLGGKCADINALYVGLARASGLPARDVYGIRVAPSRRGYKSLGANTEVISKSQHCRAEVWLDGFGWVPVDPADVRKVALEEPPGNLPLNAAPVQRARETLFGAWEMNWIPYNTAHDLTLPGWGSGTLPFLMYPTGRTGDVALDSLDPDAFAYTITSREIVG